MSDEHVFSVDDYLSESWIEEWASEGLRAAEEYLGRQAAFDSFLESE
jgi:hypothetical protein